ncbi:MAG: potassium channel family protein, partial [Acidobacteriota bacterium]
ATVSAGAAAYHWLEGWSLLDSFYMVVITLSTVGFGEVRPLSPSGQVVTMGVILFGLMALTLVVGSVTRMVLEGEIRRVLGRRRMERDVGKLTDHYIVCGYGRVGKVVCRELADDGVPLVVVDNDPEMLAQIDVDGHLVVLGDATEEPTLVAAGIERAKGLILALPNEADNVYVTLQAKEHNPQLFVLARSISDHGERRLRAVGADRMVSPNRLGAQRIAQSVLKPSVVEFIDIVTGRKELTELELQELKVPEKSNLAGKTLKECDIRRKYGLMVVGILQADGMIAFNPSPRDQIDAGLTLIVLGRRRELDRFAASI